MNLLAQILGLGNELRGNAKRFLRDPLGHANAQVGAFNDQAQAAGNALLNRGATKEERAASANRLIEALGVGPAAIGAIKVYHGSPHVFNKADSSKIGTGEGAQAYGHGLYWAEQPETARSYMQEPRPNAPERWLVNGRPYKATAHDGASVLVGQLGEEGALTHLQHMLDQSVKYSGPKSAEYQKNLQGQIDAIKSGRITPAVENKGQMYEANLRWPDPVREAKDPLGPQHFLDWDKPLSQQGDAVREAISKIPGGYVTGSGGERRFVGDFVRSQRNGGGLLDDLRLLRRGQPETILQQAGIPGITYLDQGSRAAGQGTRNYVTFDDALVDLLLRNGQPIKGNK